ncbi:MAG: bifunctional glutamate N-acetyltransferase/amino-acid acetyltransferase ArgJ [Nitrospinota bacterium]|nr:bifunctional glutamate N-acetyltransferase/amino-acid acetyltransferase ArgJ [Nitrospinota bacterium]
MKLKELKNFKVPGFLASGMACGLKKKEGIRDLTLIYSEVPAVAAGMFTQNQMVSPTVPISRKALKASATTRAIIANSGNANAFTGPQGVKDCKAVVAATAKALDIQVNEVLTASTGVISVPLAVNKITAGIPSLVNQLSPDGWIHAAEGIMTTDLVSKTCVVQYDDIVVGGITKGSGMIQPNMATMLAFLASNIRIDKRTLRRALKEAVDPTFNCITVDGETSTNDMVLLMANGQAGNAPVKAGSQGYKDFVSALTHVCKTLAFKIVEDGEGATKFVTFKVSGAKTRKQAEQIGKRLANSLLVKTALFGEDPNWGRIIAAVGSAGVPILPEKLEVLLNETPLVKNGQQVKGVSQSSLQKIMKKKQIGIAIDLHMGKASAETYTCDLSYDYVRINAEYTT